MEMIAPQVLSGLGQPLHRNKSTNGDVPQRRGVSNTRHRPPVYSDSSALEKLPHVCSQVCSLWSQREVETYVDGLIMDSGDGTRQGLPWDVAQELLFLLQLSIAKRAIVASEVTGVPFTEMFAQCLGTGGQTAAGGTDPFSDPSARFQVADLERDRAPLDRSAPIL